MCGIVGVVQYDSKVSKEIRQRALKILFADIMLRTLSRGRDATGIYQVMGDGDWMMAKKAEKVTDWLFKERSDGTDPQIYQDFAESWGTHARELRALVGHCRAKTVGSASNENNHPFAIQVDEKNAILGVHNGTLDNHERVFEMMPKIVERQGSTDSEAIFHYLFYATEHGTKEMDPQVLESLGERIDGAYAVIMANSRFPHQVTVFRQTRPMHMFLVSPLNIVLLASDSKFIKESLEQYDFIRQSVMPDLPKLKTDDRILSERDYRIFDTRKEFPQHLNYQSIQDISEGGEFKKTGATILEDWRKNPVSKSSSKGDEKSGGTDHKPKISKVGDKKITAKSDKGDEESTTVEVEILDEDGKALDIPAAEAKVIEESWKDAKSIGLTASYETDRELAKQLGISDVELAGMGQLQLASRLSKLHFAVYYALARADSSDEVDGVKKGAREQHSRLERSEEKKKLAESKIWEFKTLSQVLTILHGRGYRLCVSNVKLVLDAYSLLGPQRKEDVLQTAKNVLEGADTKKMAEALAPRFDEAEVKKALRKKETKPALELLPSGEAT
jgi:glucosamine 6-phosphate synthetase-like amidotransferase/phosphosugar isomerase protein